MSEEVESTVPERVSRVSVLALDEILGTAIPVLDRGFVRPVDYMGGDSAIVQAARVSYGAGTKKISEDEGLIRYLLRHSHTTPFEMCEIKFHVRVPMDCWRQWIRHRAASVNEYSTRYSIAIDDKQETPPGEWRLQSATNKQGSGGFLTEFPPKEVFDSTDLTSPGDYLSMKEKKLHKFAADVYEERIKLGVAKEQARKDLPLSTYTEAYWKIDLHNLLHFLSLRMDSHAQLEIRLFANAVGSVVEKWCPLAWKAFNDYNFRRDALLLSARDKNIITLIHKSEFSHEAIEAATRYGWLEKKADGTLKANRERSEFEAKARELGVTYPW